MTQISTAAGRRVFQNNVLPLDCAFDANTLSSSSQESQNSQMRLSANYLPQKVFFALDLKVHCLRFLSTLHLLRKVSGLGRGWRLFYGAKSLKWLIFPSQLHSRNYATVMSLPRAKMKDDREGDGRTRTESSGVLSAIQTESFAQLSPHLTYLSVWSDSATAQNHSSLLPSRVAPPMTVAKCKIFLNAPLSSPDISYLSQKFIYFS